NLDFDLWPAFGDTTISLRLTQESFIGSLAFRPKFRGKTLIEPAVISSERPVRAGLTNVMVALTNSLRVPSFAIFDAQFNHVVAGYADGEIDVYDVKSGALLPARILGEPNPVAAAICPSGDRLLTLSEQQILELRELPAGVRTRTVRLPDAVSRANNA